jgi:hypothetical protein
VVAGQEPGDLLGASDFVELPPLRQAEAEVQKAEGRRDRDDRGEP